MSPITTHILDTSHGRPARGVTVVLDRQAGPELWDELGRGTTNDDGRIAHLWPDGMAVSAGIYRLRFATAAYFRALGVDSFYPEVQVVFQIADVQAHYHVPLLLSPYGYSTYRGSR